MGDSYPWPYLAGISDFHTWPGEEGNASISALLTKADDRLRTNRNSYPIHYFSEVIAGILFPQ